MPDLTKIAQTGDLIFARSNNWFPRMIRKFTFGTVNHVAIVYDSEQVFEADNPGVMKFNPINDYAEKEIEIYRLATMTDEQKEKVKELCKKYENDKYSVLDIVTNALLFWLAAPLRQRAVAAIGNKKFMVCSECAGRIIYEATGLKAFRFYEGLTPADELIICQTHIDFKLELSTLK